MAENQENNSTTLQTPNSENEKASKGKKIVHLWEKEIVDVLNGIGLAAREGKVTADDQTKHQPASSISTTESLLPVARLSDKMFCVTCSVEFEERIDQKEHYKSDWHRFNLKRKLKEQSVVTEQEFESITSTGDLSSISGSDSSSEEDSPTAPRGSSWGHEEEEEEEENDGWHVEGIGKRHPRIFLRNGGGELLSIYRCVVHGKKGQADTAEELLSMVSQLASQTSWCVLMLAGGHFAAALFDGDKVVEHKTFHRYVVRAKRGTVQSIRDNKGGAPKSGGASIRRYNEAALAKEVQDLMTSWADQLQQCHRIFLRLPTYNKAILFGGKSPILDKQDRRIRLIPLQTRRPTFKELKRVHDILSSVECYGTESVLGDHITASPKKPSQPPVKSSAQKQAPSKAQQMSKVLENLQDSSEDADLDVELFTDTVTMDTSELQPFEATKKPNKKKKGKKKVKADDQVNLPTEQESVEYIILRNDLYTACKTKDTENFRTLLSKLTVDYDRNPNSDTFDGDNVQKENNQSAAVNIDPESTTLPQSHLHGNKDQPESTTPDPGKPGTNDGIESVDMPTSVGRTDKSTIVSVLNRPFGACAKTLLMVASEAGHKEALSLLMEAGADPAIKDNQGQLAYHLAASKDTRNEFRRFVGKYPDMYDYTQAQIPGPMSEEQEIARKEREAQRRKAMKKAKKERLKDQKDEEAKIREEERETRRYLSLSDREKRALAAERRLVAQSSSKGESTPVLSRCFQCAADVTGKVPFEYSDYKFCTTKCLKEHRIQKQTQKSS